MRQTVFIVLALFFLIIILIGLNAATYVQKEEKPDTEEYPNRSTYNVGATGTRAFYDLLAESGYKVIRWREPIKRFNSFEANKLATFVIVGKTRRKIKKEEKENLLDWVEMGGTVVFIDRGAPENLISETYSWDIYTDYGDDHYKDKDSHEDKTEEVEENEKEETKSEVNEETEPEETVSPIEEKIEKESQKGSHIFKVDPSNQQQMTLNTKAAKPTQPTIFTSSINSVQPSKFASSISFSRIEDEEETEDVGEGSGYGSGEGNPPSEALPENYQEPKQFLQMPPTKATPPPPPPPVVKTIEEEEDETYADAPVVHLANDEKNILVDFPYGAGRIIFLSDPYIVANGGIRILDNAQIGINIAGSRDGVIAFDEYHQGYGNNENRLFQYLEGTPVIAIILQIFAIIALIFYSQSRRFARALPPNDPNRLSKLEYVSAMAQLQRRTKAFDLAIENIYRDFRRRVSLLLGVDNKTAKREELAKLIAERTEFETDELEEIMFKCEDIMHGEPTNKKEIIRLTGRLREIEEKLGLARSKRKRR